MKKVALLAMAIMMVLTFSSSAVFAEAQLFLGSWLRVFPTPTNTKIKKAPSNLMYGKLSLEKGMWEELVNFDYTFKKGGIYGIVTSKMADLSFQSEPVPLYTVPCNEILVSRELLKVASGGVLNEEVLPPHEDGYIYGIGFLNDPLSVLYTNTLQAKTQDTIVKVILPDVFGLLRYVVSPEDIAIVRGWELYGLILKPR